MVEILLEAGMDPNCFDGASGTDILLVLVAVIVYHSCVLLLASIV